MVHFRKKEGDMRPYFSAQLRYGHKRPAQLQDADEVRFYVGRPPETDGPDDPGELYINGTAEIVDGPYGEVAYHWDPETDALPQGTHHAEFVVHWGTDTPDSFPNKGYYKVEVTDGLPRGMDPAEVEPNQDITVAHISAATGSYDSLSVGGEDVTTGLANLDGRASELENKTSGITADGSAASFDEFDVTNDADLTINVPTDFATLGEALEFSAQRKVMQGTQVVVNLETGFQIGEHITLEDGDWSHVRITSADAQVGLDPNVAFNATELWTLTNAKGPQLDTVIDLTEHADTGSYVRNSSITVLPDGGLINAGSHNIHAYGGQIFAPSCVFTGAGGNGIYLDRQSNAVISHSDFSNSNFGILMLGDSQAMFRSGVVENCTDRNIMVNQRSSLCAHGAAINGGGEYNIISSQFSIVDARNSSLDDAGQFATFARRGGRILADLADINNAGRAAFFVERGGMIQAWNTRGTSNGAYGAPVPGSDDDSGPREITPIQEGVWTKAGIVISNQVKNGEHSWDNYALHTYNASNGAIAQNTDVKVQWTEIQTDPAGAWNTTNSTFTVPHPGHWRISGAISFRNSSPGDELRMMLGRNNSPGSNGNTFIFGEGSTDGTTLQSSRIINCDQGDELGMWVNNQSGADELGGYDGMDYMQMEFVRPEHPNFPTGP